MKLSKIIKTIEVIEEKRVPNDILEGFLYHSASREEPIQIHDMDIVHLVRAFKNALHKLDNQYTNDKMYLDTMETNRARIHELVVENKELKKQIKEMLYIGEETQ
jgi:hypothetical protein